MRRRLALGGLIVWSVGVQCSEAVATTGLVLTTIAAIPVLGAEGWRRTARAWWPLLAFLGWCSVVPALTGHPPTWAGQARLLDWVGLPAASAALTLLAPRDRRRLCLVAFGALAVSCAVAFAQYRGWWPGLEAFASLRWTRIPFHRVYEPVPGPPGRFMAGGLLFHRLQFAAVSGLVVVWCASVALVRRSPVAAVLAGVATLAVVVLPHARAAAGALAVGLVTAVALATRGRQRRVLGGSLVAVACVALLVPSVRNRLVAFATERPDGSRAALLRSGLTAVTQHPWTGVGPGRFRPGSFADEETPEEVRLHGGKSHDQWITVAAEAGVPAAVLFLVLLLMATLAPSSDPVGGVARRSAIALFAALTLVHDPLFHPVTSMATVLAIGLGLDPRRGLRPSGAPPDPPPG